MRFNFRKQIRVGPLCFNFAKSGFTSWGIKGMRVTKNFTHGTTTVDTPGPGSVTFGGKRRQR